jgi:RNA polymerase sigma factor (sigma-70 family)
VSGFFDARRISPVLAKCRASHLVAATWSRTLADRSFAIDYDGLFRRCADSVYRICRAVLENHEAAEDATQDVFRKLLSNPPKWHVENVPGWLNAAARTTAIDHLRAMRNAGPLDETDEPPDPSPGPEEHAIGEDLRRRIWGHLDKLTPDQRRVVELRIEGIPAKDVAQLLGRSVGWVNTTFKRALDRLRTIVGPELDRKEGAR